MERVLGLLVSYFPCMSELLRDADQTEFEVYPYLICNQINAEEYSDGYRLLQRRSFTYRMACMSITMLV